jgi:DNA ligase (NAD+)
LLDSSECAKRKLTFVAWDIIGKHEKCDSLNAKLHKLMDLNFEVVPFTIMGTIEESVEWLKECANICSYPIDGLVFKLRKCEEYEAMGRTDHHFRGGMAFKFYDELYETKLTNVEWTLGKTGTLTPTAIFKTVQIDGCDISRASLHNISIIKKLGLTNNCTVKISKRNEIIPQVEECLQDGDSPIKIPKYCPVCGGETEVVTENASEVLMCKNPNCLGKLLGRLKFFVSKPATNIEGLSEATLEFLIAERWVKKFKDIYHLKEHKYEWEQFDGFGVKSVDKILKSIEESRNITCANFIAALSIDGVGKSAAKTLSDAFEGDFYELIEAFDNDFDWTTLTDIGDKTAQNINEYLAKNQVEIWELAQEFNFIMPK